MSSTTQFTPFLPVTALRSFMSHFDSASPARHSAPSSPETPAVIETPAERRGIEVAGRYFPWLDYGRRLKLVRAVVKMTEHPDSPRFEVEIRAAYRGAVVEVEVEQR